MKHYIGTKELLAKPMTRGEYNVYRGWDTPEEEDPLDQGYLVEYLDSPNPNHENHENYISWSPADVFERTYRELGEGEPDEKESVKDTDLTFGQAIEVLKDGQKVARAGWNGKGMYIYIQEGSMVSGQSRNPIMQEEIDKDPVKTVKLNPHIDMKSADGSFVIGWLASQTDMLSEDWFIVE